MANKKAFTANMPYDLMYQASRKEASRKKPIFFIHKYFARRITANYRMMLLGYLANPEDDLYNAFYRYSKPFGNRDDITILDPFMGGGTTIFEALRFGCKVIGTDLQPLSLFVTKALIEPVDKDKVKKAVGSLEKSVGNRIKKFYKTTCPCCGAEADVMYAFHVKEATTKSPCRVHKFYSSFILAYRNNEFTVLCPKCGKIHKTDFKNGEFKCDCGWVLTSPRESYVNNGIFECPECHEKKVLTDYVGNTGYPFETEIIALEYYCPNCNTHDYKSADSSDKELYKKACEEFNANQDQLPIPDQEIPEGYNTNQILNHGYKKYRDLFNKRQLLCLGLLLKEINNFEDKDTEFWLQLAFSGMLEMNNMFCRYQQNAYKICNIFFNHAYVPITMPVENCVWGTKLGTGTFIKTVEKILRGKEFNNNIYDLSVEKNADGKYDSAKIFNGDSVSAVSVDDYSDLTSNNPLLKCSDSRDLSFIPDNSVDMVLTDPPYGANVMYSELIDFFHVWNYESSLSIDLGFVQPLSPKQNEIIVNPVAGKTYQYYQDGITEVFSQCYQKVKQDGYLVFSFHDIIR